MRSQLRFCTGEPERWSIGWLFGPLVLALCCGIWLCAAVALAHGPVHEQIERLDEQLAEQTENADLYFRRGRLFLIDEDWPAALQDFDRVEALDPSLWTVDIFRAEALMGEEQFDAATRRLKAYLERPEEGTTAGNRARAWFLLGQVHDQLARPLEAAEAYGRSIDLLERPTPDHYLARSRALSKAGSDHLEAAIKALDQGNVQLGSLVVLEREALAYEVELRAFDRALARLDRLIEKSRRQESWLVERGKVLLAARRLDEARASFEAAQAALAVLPPHRRGTRAMVELANEITSQLDQLPAPDSSAEDQP